MLISKFKQENEEVNTAELEEKTDVPMDKFYKKCYSFN